MFQILDLNYKVNFSFKLNSTPISKCSLFFFLKTGQEEASIKIMTAYWQGMYFIHDFKILKKLSDKNGYVTKPKQNCLFSIQTVVIFDFSLSSFSGLCSNN